MAPDEHIDFSHLKRHNKMTQLEFEDEVASDLQRATGLVHTNTAEAPSLSRMLQLSGELHGLQFQGFCRVSGTLKHIKLLGVAKGCLAQLVVFETCQSPNILGLQSMKIESEDTCWLGRERL